MIENIVFDLGGVLIDWDPRYMYRKVFKDTTEMEHFLSHICTSSWNEQQDAGRSIADANKMLISEHPKYAAEITMFYDRWMEMLNGPIAKNVSVFRRLRDQNVYPLYALTNWSAETMPWARPLFPFLEEFDGMVVSGIEKVKKPDDRIFKILFDRFQIAPDASVFIDDNKLNIDAAGRLGMKTVWMQKETDLESELGQLGVVLKG